MASLKWRWAGYVARQNDDKINEEDSSMEISYNKAKCRKIVARRYQGDCGKELATTMSNRETWKELEEIYIQEWMATGWRRRSMFMYVYTNVILQRKSSKKIYLNLLMRNVAHIGHFFPLITAATSLRTSFPIRQRWSSRSSLEDPPSPVRRENWPDSPPSISGRSPLATSSSPASRSSDKRWV